MVIVPYVVQQAVLNKAAENTLNQFNKMCDSHLNCPVYPLMVAYLTF